MVHWLFYASAQLAADRRGFTPAQYAMIAGMIAVVIMAMISAFGGDVSAGQ